MVEVNDKDEEHVPMAFVVRKDDIDESEQGIIKQILKKCEKELKQNEVPKHIKIIEALPYTQNGKYDFRKLEEEGNRYVEYID